MKSILSIIDRTMKILHPLEVHSSRMAPMSLIVLEPCGLQVTTSIKTLPSGRTRQCSPEVVAHSKAGPDSQTHQLKTPTKVLP